MTSAMTSRRDEIIRLRKEGQTHAEIGRRFDITKERVRQILTPSHQNLRQKSLPQGPR